MIDKPMLKNFRDDFAEAVKGLEQKYGVIIDLGHINYTATRFSGTLTVSEGDSRDEVNRAEYMRLCQSYGLKPEWFDLRFNCENKEYAIIGLRPSKRKYPVTCYCFTDDQTYSFAVQYLRKVLADNGID